MNTKIYFGFFLIIAGTLFSCASTIPSADSAHQKWASHRWEGIQLAEAQSLYSEHCSGCHSLPSPMEHTQKEWEVYFGEMAGRSHMNTGDSIAVFAYLESFSKDNILIAH
ncbi:MAG: hypothetical protein WCH46_05565 [bacterium]